MQYLVWMFKQTQNKACKFELYSIIRDHFKSCRESSCLCFLLRYKVFHLPGENIFKGMQKLNENKKQEKLILYDYDCGIEQMKYEHDDLIESLQKKKLERYEKIKQFADKANDTAKVKGG